MALAPPAFQNALTEKLQTGAMATVKDLLCDPDLPLTATNDPNSVAI
jgi:hypothetical protein